MLHSNNMSNHGSSCNFSTIYTKEKYEELMKKHTSRVFLAMGTWSQSVQVQVIVKVRHPKGPLKI